MPKFRPILLASLAAVIAACDATDPTSNLPTDPRDPVTPPAPTAPAPSLARLEFNIAGTEFYSGSVTASYLRGFDTIGRLVDVDKAIMSSSNPAVLSLSGSSSFNWTHHNGPPRKGLRQVFTLLSPGTAFLRASLDGVIDSVRLTAIPLPAGSSAIAIDSFTVLEYRAPCNWDCPYLVYAPLLKLREPTGSAAAYVLAVQFNVSTTSTGLCNVGQLRLGPGFTGHINAVDPYLWANDMILVQLDGTPLPPGSASVRVIFRDATGKDGIVEGTGEIQRMVRDPVFPPSPFAGTSWSCAFHLLGG